MFIGGGAPTFDADVMSYFAKEVRTGAAQPGMAGMQAVADRQYEELKNQQLYNMFTQALMGESYARAGRGIPARNIRDEQGYGNLSDPSYFDKETILPFDNVYDSSKNYYGIVNAYGSTRFGASEQIVNSLKQLNPVAQRALGYHGSIYDGVPPDFAVNRLYIANQRNREDSVYAFI